MEVSDINNYVKSSVFLIVILILVCFCVSAFAESESSETHILILNPYTSDFPASTMYEQGVKLSLIDNGMKDVVYSYENMDIGRFSNDKQYLESVAEYFLYKYSGANSPDYIISIPQAKPFLLKYGVELFPDTRIFYVESQADSSTLDLPDGFYPLIQKDSLRIGVNIDLVLSLFPDVDNIIFVLGDTAYERMILDRIHEVEKTCEGLTFTYLNKLPYREMIDVLKNADSNSVAYYVILSSDVNGDEFIPAQIVYDICEQSAVPVFGAGRQYINSGVVGGFVYDLEVLGERTGDLIYRIEQGEAIDESDLLVKSNHYMFDWNALSKWNISETDLPANSKIINKKYNIWQLYKREIIIAISVLILQFALIIVLLKNIRMKKEAQYNLKELNDTLETEVEIRTQDLNIVVEQLKETNDLLIMKSEQLEHIATTDKLTNIGNRHKLDEMLKHEMERYERYKTAFSIIIIDIDFFKIFNDKYGHQTGDLILVELADLLKGCVRRVDFVGRWGGEEFMIICPHTNLDRVKALAEKLRAKVENTMFVNKYKVTISLGVANFVADDDERTIFKRADESLYNAKTNGRNRVGV